MKQLFKIILACSVLVIASLQASAQITPPPPQATGTSTPSRPDDAAIQEILQRNAQLRDEVLDAFGIPRSTPLNIVDLLGGKTIGGITIPDRGIKGIDLEPLNDLKMFFDRKDMKPGNRVRAFVVTFTADLQRATITWYHNGKRISSGRGNTFYDFTLGEVGSTEQIRAVITTDTGKTREVSKTARPARIYLTWGSDAYAPAWYRGKALPPPGAPIKIIAVPDFRLGSTVLGPQEVTYEWLINDAEQTSSSGANGRGKNTFSFNSGTSPSVSYKITVRGKDDRDRIVHEESLVVRTFRPDLVFYERDPLLGVKTWKAIREASVPSGQDFVLQLEPFYVHNQDLARLFYSWKVNGEKLANQNPQSRIFRLSSEAGSSGTQSINVAYENPKNVFVRGSGFVTVRVGE